MLCFKDHLDRAVGRSAQLADFRNDRNAVAQRFLGEHFIADLIQRDNLTDDRTQHIQNVMAAFQRFHRGRRCVEETGRRSPL